MTNPSGSSRSKNKEAKIGTVLRFLGLLKISFTSASWASSVSQPVFFFFFLIWILTRTLLQRWVDANSICIDLHQTPSFIPLTTRSPTQRPDSSYASRIAATPRDRARFSLPNIVNPEYSDTDMPQTKLDDNLINTE